MCECVLEHVTGEEKEEINARAKENVSCKHTFSLGLLTAAGRAESFVRLRVNKSHGVR